MRAGIKQIFPPGANKKCRSRGDETQIEEKLETPHVVSYEMEARRADSSRRNPMKAEALRRRSKGAGKGGGIRHFTASWRGQRRFSLRL
jgi:hypothetical protein